MPAVSIEEVSFGFANKTILKDIDAEIESGEIYSLLGPSGAGKTTLLRLVLGLLRPSSGRISVFGHAPGKYNRLIGYMPQDMALCATFTVGQTLHYFASIYRLSHAQLEARKKEIGLFLNLPNEASLVADLSGGQKKLLSLCLAFLHQPKLLILDEPTVGSDSEIRDCIWKYLHQCCQVKVGIVIVTHYIEEASLGNRVGFLRGGRLLEQGPAQALKLKYNQPTLQDVFLYLCEHKEHPAEPEESKVIITMETEEAKQLAEQKMFTTELRKSTLESNNLFQTTAMHLWIVVALIRKNLFEFYNFARIVAILFPPFIVFLVASVYGRDAVPVHTAVFNEESPTKYSQWFLNSIQKVDVYYVNPLPQDSFKSMIESVKSGKAIGGVWFGKNFSDSLEERLLEPNTIDNETLVESNLKIYVNNMPFLFANGLVDSLRETAFRLIGHIYVEHGQSQPETPIVLKETVYGEGSKLVDFFLAGYMLCMAYLLLTMMCSQLLQKEKNDGLFERCLIAGVGHRLVLFAHYLASCIVGIVMILLMLIAMKISVYPVYNRTTYAVIFLHLLAQSSSAIATGLFISALIKDASSAGLLAIALVFPQFFAGGAIFPLEFVKLTRLRPLLYWLCPISIPSASLRNSMHRGWTLTHPLVCRGIGLNLLSTVALCLGAAFIFRRYSKFQL